jgi:hypothetical protein
MRRLNQFSWSGFGIWIQGPVLRQKAEEVSLELNIDFVPSSGWHDHSENMQGLAKNQEWVNS